MGFVNRVPVPVMAETPKRSPVETWWNFLFGSKKGQRPGLPIPSVRTDLKTLTEDKMVWLGHSGFYIKKWGLGILIDPALNDSSPVPGFFRPFKGADIYKAGDLPPHIDLLVITHDHYDHLDYKVVQSLKGRVGQVVCPLGVGLHFEKWGWDPDLIVELDWYEGIRLGDLDLTLTPSQHFSGRSMKRNETLWGGYVFAWPDITVYFSGDGGYGPHFKEVGRWWRPDLAVVEIGQYDDAWAGIHLRPQDWVRAVADIGAVRVMGCHHAKYCLSNHTWYAPLEAEEAKTRELGAQLFTPKIGAPLDLQKVLRGEEKTLPWWKEAMRADL